MGNRILDTFLNAMSSERSFSTNSLASYAYDIKKFQKFQLRSQTSILQSTRQQIESFLKEEFDLGLSSATRARRLSSIKQFFKFMLDENLRQDNPAIKIK